MKRTVPTQPDERVLEAANPAQAYTTRFTQEGIFLHPRASSKGSPWPPRRQGLGVKRPCGSGWLS